MQVQHIFWTGSIPTLKNPRLFSSIGFRDWIVKYNRIYVPKDIIQFDAVNPLMTVCKLPSSVVGAAPKVENNVEADEDQTMTSITLSQLGLTKRFFYYGLGDLYLSAISACDKISLTGQLLLCDFQGLMLPLYESKSMVMACNLLNAMFTEMFNYCGIPPSDHRSVFDSLSGIDPPKHSQISALSGRSEAYNMLGLIFDLGEMSFNSVTESGFYKLWSHALPVVDELNE